MLPTDPYEPFVLLDDARENGADARLFRDPVEIVAAQEHGEIPVALERLEAARRDAAPVRDRGGLDERSERSVTVPSDVLSSSSSFSVRCRYTRSFASVCGGRRP